MNHPVEPDSGEQEPAQARRASVEPARRRRLRSKRIWILLVMFPAALLLGELAFRALLALRGAPYGTQAAAEQMRAIVTTMSKSLPEPQLNPDPAVIRGHVLQPYIGLDLGMALDDQETRARRFQSGELDQVFIVVLLGGSVSAQIGNTQYLRIAERISQDARFAQRGVVVWGEGRGSLKQPQQATLLAYLFALGWRPDAVVEIDGYNELALAWDNANRGAHPVYPAYWSWALLSAHRSDLSRELQMLGEIVSLAREARETSEAVLSHGLNHSAILGWLALSRLGKLEHRWSRAQQVYLETLVPKTGHDTSEGPRFEFRGDDTFERLVDCWYQSSLSLSGMCAAHGATYLHVLQPALHDEGSKPLTEAERSTAGKLVLWNEAIRRGYPKLREAGQQLVRSGVHFADLSGVFRDFRETAYYDGCHFKGRGLEMFADRIADELLAVLPAQVLVIQKSAR